MKINPVFGAGALVLALGSALNLPGSDAPGPPARSGSDVGTDGTCQFRSIQEAINAAPQNCSASSPWTIRVRPGRYHELLYVQREKRFVRLRGDDPSRTEISFGLYASMPFVEGGTFGTFRTPTVWIDADDFSVANLTISNSSIRKGQAVALRVDGDRVDFRNCRFSGWQDTILANRGRQYFGRCTISGAVDFIFGGATAFFDDCVINCMGDGYISAASTPSGQAFGFVFSRCHVTGADGVLTYLGRPWRPYANVIFVDTEMSAVVRPEGWSNWKHPEWEMSAHFAESRSSGAGANPAARVTWARELGRSEAERISAGQVLAGSDRWCP